MEAKQAGTPAYPDRRRTPDRPSLTPPWKKGGEKNSLICTKNCSNYPIYFAIPYKMTTFAKNFLKDERLRMKDERLITFVCEDERWRMKDERLITFVCEDERWRMKDERLITFVYEFQSWIYFVFHPVSLILHPNSVLRPLSTKLICL